MTSLDQSARRFLGPGEVIHKYAICRDTGGRPGHEHDRCPVHWPGRQVPVVVAFRRDDDALDSTAQEVGDQSRLALDVPPRVHEHDRQPVLFGHFADTECQL